MLECRYFLDELYIEISRCWVKQTIFHSVGKPQPISWRSYEKGWAVGGTGHFPWTAFDFKVLALGSLDSWSTLQTELVCPVTSDRCPYRKWRRPQTSKVPWWPRRGWGKGNCKPRKAPDCQGPQEAETEAGNIFSPKASRREHACQHLGFGLLVKEPMQEWTMVLLGPWFVGICYCSPWKLTLGNFKKPMMKNGNPKRMLKIHT